MTYAAYLKFYGLKDTKDNREAWLESEWHKGRAYKYDGEYYSTATGKKLG